MTLPSQASIVSIKTYIRPNDDVYAVYTFADGRQQLWFVPAITNEAEPATQIPSDAKRYYPARSSS